MDRQQETQTVKRRERGYFTAYMTQNELEVQKYLNGTTPDYAINFIELVRKIRCIIKNNGNNEENMLIKLDKERGSQEYHEALANFIAGESSEASTPQAAGGWIDINVAVAPN